MGLRTRIAALVVVALVAAACGDDEAETVGSADTAGGEQAYLELISELRNELDESSDSLFDATMEQRSASSIEAFLSDMAGAIDATIELDDGFVAELRGIDPPAAYEGDHERLLAYMEARREFWVDQAATARSFDIVGFETKWALLGELELDLIADVSGGFALAVSPGDNSNVDTFLTELAEADADYLAAVEGAWNEFTRRVVAFQSALQQSYATDELLLQALLDAGAGEAFAAVEEAAKEIDPPTRYEAAHVRLLEYLAETVRLDRMIAEAAAAGDVVGFEVADAGLQAAGAEFALDAPPEVVAAASGIPIAELFPWEVPGGAYGEAVAEALREFRIRALDAPLSSGTFPLVSPEDVMATLVQIEPSIIATTDATLDTFAGIDAPAEYEESHARVVDYLTELLGIRTAALEAGREGDAETLREYGYLTQFDAAPGAETQLWCAARGDLEDDAIWPIVETFFEPFGGSATVGQLCPA